MTARSHASSGASVTLIFFNLHDTWYLGNEPLINIGAAGAQGSRLVHTEIALGEDSGRNGEMTNVLRIYNDDVGCARACAHPPHARCTQPPSSAPPPSRPCAQCRADKPDWKESAIQIRAGWVLAAGIGFDAHLG